MSEDRIVSDPSDIGAFPYPFKRLKYLKEYIRILENFRYIKKKPRKHEIPGESTS